MLLVFWSGAILVCFVHEFSSLLQPTVDALGDVLLSALMLYATWFTGHRVLRRCVGNRLDGLPGLEHGVLEVGLGSGVIIGCVFFLGLAGFYQPVWAYGLLIVGLIGSHRAFLGKLKARRRRKRTETISPLLVGIVLLMAGMTLIQSLAPPASQDALVYHLAIPEQYIGEGGIHYIRGNFFAQFPQNVEMLFTWGMLLKGPALAKLVHWLYGVGSCLAVAALARLLHQRASALLAATTFATIPTAALISGWAYVDLAVVFYTLLSTICFLRFWGDEKIQWLVLAGCHAGLAAGCKYTAGVQVIFVACGVLALAALRQRRFQPALAQAFIVCAVGGLLVGPWLIKSFVYTGNPLYPFAFDLFGGRDWDLERSLVLGESLKQWGGERSLFADLLLPWRLTMFGEFFSQENYDGVIGCAFLIGLPIVLAGLRLSSPQRVVFALVFVHFVVWATMTRQIRFLLPACALFGALLSASLVAVQLPSVGRRVVHGTLMVAFSANLLMASLCFGHHRPLAVVLGLESESEYLDRQIPGGDYAVFEFINQTLPDDSYLLFASLGNPGFLCKRRFYADAFFENHTLKAVLAEAETSEEAYEWVRSQGFTHLLFRFDCVFDASGKKSDLPVEDQQKLASMLNVHAKLLFQKAGTFLYVLSPIASIEPEPENGCVRATRGDQRTFSDVRRLAAR